MFFLKGALYDAGLTPSPVTLFWKDARICASVGETLVVRAPPPLPRAHSTLQSNVVTFG